MWTFVASHVWTLLAVLASTGAVGAVLAVALFGVPAAVLLARVVGLARDLVGFLKTPAGQAAAVVALCALCFLAGDIHRTRLDAAARTAEIKAAAAAEIVRTAVIKADVARDAAARIADIEREKSDLEARAVENDRALAALRGAVIAQQSTELDKRAHAYEQTLPASAACLATDDDVVRMRQNRAAAAGLSHRPAGRLRGRVAPGSGPAAAQARRGH